MRGLLFLLALLWLAPIGVVLIKAARRGRSARYLWWPALLSWPGALIAITRLGRRPAVDPKFTEEWRRYYAHLRQCPGSRCTADRPALECAVGSALYREYKAERARMQDASFAFQAAIAIPWWHRAGWFVL